MGPNSAILRAVGAAAALALAGPPAPAFAGTSDMSGVGAAGAASAMRDAAAPANAKHAWMGGGGAAEPRRIVSLTPSVTETLFALGAGPSVVAVSDYCDYPPQVGALPRVGSFLAPVIERVLSLEPDLVITSPSPGNRNAVLAIERAGVATAVVSEGSGSLEDVRASILQTSAAIGLEHEGRALVARIDRRLEAVRKAVEGRARPKTMVLVGFEPLVLAGPDSYLGQLVEVAGGSNVAAALRGKWPRVGWELVLASAPQVVIDLSSPMSGADARSAASRWSRYGELPAVRDGRVHCEGGALLLRPGPRIAEAAELIASRIHPDAQVGTARALDAAGAGDGSDAAGAAPATEAAGSAGSMDARGSAEARRAAPAAETWTRID